MQDGARDFSAFAAARWPALVRTAILLGCPLPLAPDVATTALARLSGRWARLVSQGDPDVEALRLLLETWSETARGPWWVSHPAGPTARDLAPLDSLTPRARSAAVLEHLHGLAPQDIEEILGRPRGKVAASAAPPVGETVQEPAWVRARSLPVGDPVPSTDVLRQRARGRRARRTRSWAVRTVPVVLVVAVGVAMAGAIASRLGDATPALTRVATTSSSIGQAWMTWYADGELHLGSAVVTLPGVRQVVGVTGGAVYVDADGRVVRVSPRGARVQLGSTVRSSSLVVSDDGGLVGWVDDGDTPTLVVADSADGGARRELAHVPRDTRPVELRDDQMFVVTGARTASWRFADDALQGLTDQVMVEASGRLAAFRDDDQTLSVATLGPDGAVGPASSWIKVPGDEVSLPPGGGYAITRTSGGQVRVIDLSSGDELPTGIAVGEVALTVEAGPGGQVAYVVAAGADRPGSGEFVRSSFTGNLTVRTCTLVLGPSTSTATTTCRAVAAVSGTVAVPLLGP